MISDKLTGFIRDLYEEPEAFIPLHAPVFAGREKEYICDCIDSTFVSSVGEYVGRFEDLVREATGAAHATAVVNGTSALQVALSLCGVKPADLVLTQALTFVATANAISHCGAEPVFLDSDRTLGLSPEALECFLNEHAEKKGDGAFDRRTGQRIAACVPMHVVGHACRIDRLCEICEQWSIPLIEDAAEGLGSVYKGRHLGTFGDMGILSFNGNKAVTTGGGGMILCQDVELGARVKHLTSTAKVPHAWEFEHDAVAWNYRMPNVNAAIGCAQMEYFPAILREKREIAGQYAAFLDGVDIRFHAEPEGCVSNYWLNTVEFSDRRVRDAFLEQTNGAGVMTRPLWKLMTDLSMYANSRQDGLEFARRCVDRMVNLPSGTRPGFAV